MKARNTFLPVLKAVAETAIVVAAILYAAGWSYLYGYYKSFGISISNLDLSVPDALIFSFRVFFDNPAFAAGLTILVLLGVFFLSRSYRVRMLAPGMEALLLLIALFLTAGALSILGARIGERNARSDMVESSSTLPTVALTIDASECSQLGSRCREFDKLEYKLLAHTKGNFYFFPPLKIENNQRDFPSGNLTMYAVPETKVARVRIQRGY